MCDNTLDKLKAFQGVIKKRLMVAQKQCDLNGHKPPGQWNPSIFIFYSGERHALEPVDAFLTDLLKEKEQEEVLIL